MEQIPLFGPVSLSVSEITRYLRQLLEGDEVLQDLWVKGEISNLSRPVSGHIYFTLRDDTSALRCVIWRSTAARLRFIPQNGLAVDAHGSVGVYERDGTYQLYVDALQSAGEGQLFQQLMRLKALLEAEGLFDPERKRPIPERPLRVGIVTSSTGAALQDMLNTIRLRCPLVEVILSPTSVQGSEAPDEIAAAIERLNRLGKPDVILLGRGGGSLEDLWAFNDERVVRAVAASQAPVVTGIGHETDFTLADFAADFRAPTPTGAAVKVTPEKATLRSELYSFLERLSSSVLDQVGDQKHRLGAAGKDLNRLSPLWRIRNGRQRLDELAEELRRRQQHSLQLRRAYLQGVSSQLYALSPAAVLERGFAIVSTLEGQPIHTIADVKTGQQLRTRLLDGQFVSRVEES
jgi:exodeoxyribonuclease VII large subunit